MAAHITSAEDVNASLNKCTSSEISDLAHHVAHHICRGNPLDYSLYSKLWTLEEWWNVTDFLQSLFKTTTKHSWTKEQVFKVFEDLGSIPDSTKTTLYGVISVHKDAFHRHFLDETTAISHNVLTDFDWQLKLVMSK
ncbi:uncharacterized protein LOC121376425 [Gigantopelta aegis]|uniref:uncharacterized protein LOC121376425 n=1 Tax=Gigantopelta aegis TaxID=1735272 RepID=UPI001B88D288|nr:uncharacterized protein LOC121376425 [Gigantopelta aegis]